MKCKGNKKSKKQKLSTKYNIQKRVREHKRRVKKEAKKLGSAKKVRRDPGIPNNWPFKAEMLADLERKKEKKELEIEKSRSLTKRRQKNKQKLESEEHLQMQKERETERRQARSELAEKSQRDAFRRTLTKSEVLLQVLDARDPLRCRCAALETWAQEKGKRIIFVLAKADLVSSQVIAQWMNLLGQVGPVVAVQAEAGREGFAELLQIISQVTVNPGAVDATAVTAPTTVGVVGYPGTGKKSLLKNLRRDVQGQSRWLFDSVARLHPSTGSLDAGTTLHLAIRGMPLQTATGASPAWSGAEAPEVVRHLLERANPQTLMRRFRLPAYEGVDGFLKTFAKDRTLTGKKGKEPELAFVAQQVLTELSASPGCVCSPPSEILSATAALWQAHGAERPRIEAVMKVQFTALNERAAGLAAGALAIGSAAGFGPAMDVASLADAADDEMDDSDDDGEGEESEEEGEEEEGEESEEEDGDGDKGMK